MEEKRKSFRFIHTADLHAGNKQYGSSLRERDFHLMADQIADLAIKAKVEAVCFAGDNYHSTYPTATAYCFVRRATDKLRAAGIAVLGIVGNHDNDTAMLEISGITDVADIPYTSACGVVVGGIGYTRSGTFMEKLQEYVKNNPTVNVLLVHQAVAELCNFDGAALHIEDMAKALEGSAVRYVALGDIHQAAYSVVGGIAFAYPGSPERTTSDDTSSRTVYELDMTPEAITSINTYALRTRPFIRVNVDSDESLKQALSTIKEGSDAKPVVLVDYEQGCKALAKTLEGILRSMDLVFRSYPYEKGQGVVKEGEELPALNFERQSATELLRKSISVSFEPDSPASQLLHTILATGSLQCADVFVRESK